MRLQLPVSLLLVAIALTAQSPAPAPPAAGTPVQNQANAPDASTPELPKVNPEDTVITVKGLCADSTLQGEACKTVITKAEFEKMSENLQPGMSPAMRRQLAARYVQYLAMSSEAEKRGLDKTAHFEAYLRYARMQILSQELSKALQADAGNITDQDIQDYYNKNAPNYEQASLIKIFVPRTKREAPPAPKKSTGAATTGSSAAAAPKPPIKKLTPQEQEKAGEEAMKKEAALLRARLLKGEDPDTLAKAAFVAAGLPGNPPPTKVEKIRRPGLPASQQSVMDLKPGAVSEVISDATGNYIYKMIGKETMPLETVKTEIHNQLSAQRYREAMQRYQNQPDLNEAYFGPNRAPGMPMPPRGRAAAPPKDDDHD